MRRCLPYFSSAAVHVLLLLWLTDFPPVAAIVAIEPVSIRYGIAVERGSFSTGKLNSPVSATRPRMTAPEESSPPGVERDATAEGEVVPHYPLISRRRGEEGKVLVQVQIDEFGRAVKKDIIESSGSTHLDQAALEALSSTKFLPAILNGRKVPGSRTFSFVFRLNESEVIIPVN